MRFAKKTNKTKKKCKFWKSKFIIFYTETEKKENHEGEENTLNTTFGNENNNIESD